MKVTTFNYSTGEHKTWYKVEDYLRGDAPDEWDFRIPIFEVGKWKYL